MKVQLRYYMDQDSNVYEIPDLAEFWSYNPTRLLRPITYNQYELSRKR